MAYGDGPDSEFDSCSLVVVTVFKPASRRLVRAALLVMYDFLYVLSEFPSKKHLAHFGAHVMGGLGFVPPDFWFIFPYANM